MTLSLFAHPFSAYCQKVLIALYENHTPFTFRMLSRDEQVNGAEFAERWPLKRMPVLIDGEHTIAEASIIIEHLALHHPGPMAVLPQDPVAALDVRFMDRVFDNYVATPMQQIVLDRLRTEASRNARTVADARTILDTSYRWLDRRMAGRRWASGSEFSLADCAAAPALLYADWAHRIGDGHTHLRAYRDRLLARPSYARAVDEARPYRHLFPLGDPGRD